MEQAFIEMMDAQDEARGREITITVRSEPGVRTLEWPIKTDESLVDGAMAMSGGFRNVFLVSAVPFEPRVLDSIIASDGTRLQILSVNRINDTWETEAFSPVAHRRDY